MSRLVGAVDSGTSSTRFMLFDARGQVVAYDQREHRQIFPRQGWVEHDPDEIWERTREVIGAAIAKAQIDAGDIAAIGVTNQRETTIVWDKRTGRPVYNAIVWQDTRTDRFCRRLTDDGLADTDPHEDGPAALPPTSPAPRSAGSSTMSTARAPAPRPASFSSAPSIPG